MNFEWKIVCLKWLSQLVCLFLVLISYSQVVCLPSSTQLCPHDQSVALLQFKQLFTFESSASSEGYCYYDDSSCNPKMVNWKDGTDCCAWDGVTCDSVTGHVIGLDLSCSWLQGTIHSNSILFRLPHLERLNLACNDFNDSQIWPSFGRLTSLTHFNLSSSNFAGQIPSEVSHLSKLVSLDLFHNGLLEAPSWAKLIQNLTKLSELLLDGVGLNSVGPRSLMNLSSLTFLSLSSCGLQGNFPGNILNLPKLQVLNLYDNEDLSGEFPWFNESSFLKFLDLSTTSFFGELPDSINQLKSLKALDLSGSNFSGSIPGSLGNLTQITHLDLSSNQFSGKVPSSLSNLGELTDLSLSVNHFEGQIPDIFVHLPKLSLLRLDENKFTGQFPFSLVNLSKLYWLEIQDNQLTGPLPSSHIVELPNLQFLYLQRNSLNGTIPFWLFTQPLLEYLDLRRNHFTGLNLSREFQSNSLKGIDLSGNELGGPFPSSIFNLVNLTYLVLSSNGLRGTVELGMFARLENLEYLDLSNNNLSLMTTNSINSTFPQLRTLYLSSCNISKIPVFLNTLEQLEGLDLSKNKIDGLIPEWLWNMGERRISYLDLSHNFLQGFDQYLGIPPTTSPTYLYLNSNMLRGSLFIPSPHTSFYSVTNNKLSGELPLICNLTTLEYLDLSNNNFSGLIPPCLGNFSINLSVLNLKNNSFHGTMPDTFVNGSVLRSLDISHNQLQGVLPRSLANCSALEVLNLGHNMIADTFPFWLETLPELKVLILRKNRFYGQIGQPGNSSAFTKLRIIDVSYNDFTGNLPSKYFESWNSMMMVYNDLSELYMTDRKRYYYYYYFDTMTLVNKGREIELVKILSILTAVDFSNNKFHGQIPASIGELKSLHVLNFSGNGLTGQIPLSIGNLKELESLDLSKNNLHGEIPPQLTGLTFLAAFDVSQNNLTGPIPQGAQFKTFSNTSYEGNLGLCGFPLSKECGNKEEAQSPPSPSEQSHNSIFEIDGFSWKSVLMGYVCGAIIGIVFGICIFRRKEEWLMKTFRVRWRQQRKRSKKVQKSWRLRFRGV